MERRQQGAQQAGRQDQHRPIPRAALPLVARRQPGDQQQDGADQDRQAQGGGPMDQQPGGHHRRDAEVRPRRSPWESYQLLSYELAVTSEIGSP